MSLHKSLVPRRWPKVTRSGYDIACAYAYAASLKLRSSMANTPFPNSLGRSRNNGFKSRLKLILLSIKASLELKILFRVYPSEFGKGLFIKIGVPFGKWYFGE